MMNKNLYIKTYGCQMNVYDSHKMGTLLEPHGFSLIDDLVNADLIILNTCNIREKAAEKVYSELGRISAIKERNRSVGKDTVIAVAGCVAQAEGEQVVKRAPFVDVVVGPQSYHHLPLLLEKVKRSKKWVIDLDFDDDNKFDLISDRVQNSTQGVSAFLSIQEGCDKFCHFCVVPYTRGAEYSRSVDKVYREAVHLVHNGAKEITLLGQNVSAYHGSGPDDREYTMADLIEVVAKIDGLERIRYTTSHPRDMDDEKLFELHASEKKLMPFVHLPVQSGSDSVLERMNRKHTADFYIKIIDKFRSYNRDMEFSSDFIVGYPGESEEDFHDTMELVKRVNYAQAYSFKYSVRPGTPASAKGDQIPDDIKGSRLQMLQALLSKQQLLFNQRFLNRVVPVLFYKKGKEDNQIIGKSPYMQSVVLTVDSPDLYMNRIVDVRVDDIAQNSVFASVV
mgnify:FL=1